MDPNADISARLFIENDNYKDGRNYETGHQDDTNEQKGDSRVRHSIRRRQ